MQILTFLHKVGPFSQILSHNGIHQGTSNYTKVITHYNPTTMAYLGLMLDIVVFANTSPVFMCMQVQVQYLSSIHWYRVPVHISYIRTTHNTINIESKQSAPIENHTVRLLILL